MGDSPYNQAFLEQNYISFLSSILSVSGEYGGYASYTLEYSIEVERCVNTISYLVVISCNLFLLKDWSNSSVT